MEARLVATGRGMLDGMSLDTLSISSLCAAANCTVGAFYSRFDSKEAFFAAMQFVICRERDTEMAQLVLRAQGWPLPRLCVALIDDLVGWYRRNKGVLRASLQHARHGESAWSPIRQLGTEHKAIWVGLLAPLLTGRNRRSRVLFANQIVNGALVHMLLNDPGPVRLADDALSRELVRVLAAYLGARVGGDG